MGKMSNSAYERVTRQMVTDIKEDIKSLKEDMSKLSNHYSQRLPAWATMTIGVLMAVVGVLAGVAF